MSPRGSWRRALSTTAFIVCSLAAGCGHKDQGPPRVSVSGRVTVDGQPLAFGSIQFTGDSGPRAGGTVHDGAYRLDRSQGTTPGVLKVELRAPRLREGESLPRDSAARTRLLLHSPELLPARYNSQSELRVTATPAGPNQFDFELTSDTPTEVQ